MKDYHVEAIILRYGIETSGTSSMMQIERLHNISCMMFLFNITSFNSCVFEETWVYLLKKAGTTFPVHTVLVFLNQWKNIYHKQMITQWSVLEFSSYPQFRTGRVAIFDPRANGHFDNYRKMTSFPQYIQIMFDEIRR